jgi:hypothetical protein
MGAEPGTLGGQLWGEGTIEPPIHGSLSIQSGFEVPSLKECPGRDSVEAVVRFGAGGYRSHAVSSIFAHAFHCFQLASIATLAKVQEPGSTVVKRGDDEKAGQTLHHRWQAHDARRPAATARLPRRYRDDLGPLGRNACRRRE